MRQSFLFLTFLPLVFATDLKQIAPSNGPKPIGPYSPGVDAGAYVYVSGQGARTPDGKMPGDITAQTRQCLENVKSIVEAGGLTMRHVVYSQVYLADSQNLDAFEKVWREYFPSDAPARAVLGVHRMPTETPVEISAVAVRDITKKRIAAGGVTSGERFFVSGVYGSNVAEAMTQFAKNLKSAGLGLEHLAFVNVYLDASITHQDMNAIYTKSFEKGNAPARATITVAHLPKGAKVELTGVAVTDLRNRRVVRPRNVQPTANNSPCVWAGETLYCSGKTASMPGPNGGIWGETIENQVRQTFRNLLDGLEEASIDFSHVVASNVYLDQLEEFARMNGVYAKYFGATPPTRTTVQPMPAVERKANAGGLWPMLDEISIVAVK